MNRREFLRLGIAAPLVAVGIVKAPSQALTGYEPVAYWPPAEEQGGYPVPEEYIDDLLVAIHRGSAMRLDNLGI